uniref:matrix metalloproteinase-25 isoform X2 n=1 Tax=Ictidomys tridecemlineatus TaxID=43179 RepID=UPI001A9E6282|nr:matrix metalloproteinase-25 isoform X2 [Ictidomys tridecemlineatus]
MRPLALGLRFLTPLFLLARSAPASEPSAQDVSLGVDWLRLYGYLPTPDPAQAQLQSPEKLRDAIKVMQRFAGLPETGRLDKRTIETMHKPRCSLPDVLGPAGLVRRRRRYALSGSVWRKRILTWRVQSFPQSSLLNPQIVRTLMSYALTVWGVESGLTFQEVNSQHQEADILIDFARAYHQDSYPFDGLGGTLAHAFFPGEHPISGDTHFDDEEIWTFGSQGKVPQTPNDQPTRKPLIPPRPSVLPPDSPSAPVPDRCEGSFDAIANIRGETFFFKGPWFWRLQPSGQLVSPRPARVHRFWEGLPSHVRVIQAAYARRGDGRILLFSGPQFWVFRERQLEGAARPLEELGLPPGEVVDAAFSWPFNGKTYLIRGQQYWRYDEAASRPDPGYPRDLSLWEGAPPAPDDVTVGNTGDTFFFKGAHYWRFPKGSVKTAPDSPQPMGPKWLDCPAPDFVPHTPEPRKPTPKPGTCDCRCELNQASERPPALLLLSLLPLLAGVLFC